MVDAMENGELLPKTREEIGIWLRKRNESEISVTAAKKTDPGRVRGCESNQVRSHEAKKTHPGRSHSIFARVRQQPAESGSMMTRQPSCPHRIARGCEPCFEDLPSEISMENSPHFIAVKKIGFC